MPDNSTRCSACDARVASSAGLCKLARRAFALVVDLPDSRLGKWLAVLGVGTFGAFLGVADWLNVLARPALIATPSDCDTTGLNLHVANRGDRDARIVEVSVTRLDGLLNDDRHLNESHRVARGKEEDIRLGYVVHQAGPIQGQACVDRVTVKYTWSPVGLQRWLELAGSRGDPLALDPVQCNCEPD